MKLHEIFNDSNSDKSKTTMHFNNCTLTYDSQKIRTDVNDYMRTALEASRKYTYDEVIDVIKRGFNIFTHTNFKDLHMSKYYKHDVYKVYHYNQVDYLQHFLFFSKSLNLGVLIRRNDNNMTAFNLVDIIFGMTNLNQIQKEPNIKTMIFEKLTLSDIVNDIGVHKNKLYGIVMIE